MASNTPAGAERTKVRLDALTGLRWWAAFMVFLYHMQVFAPIPGPLASVLHQGYLGVTFFFVLSGFVLTWSFSPRVPTSTFYWRRFARVFPLHAIAWLVAVPVFYAVASTTVPPWVKEPDAWTLLLSLVLLQGWSLAPAVLFAGNPAAWTLTCEAFFYAFHPFVQRLLKRVATTGPLVIAGAMLLLAVAARVGAWLWPVSVFAQIPAPIQHAPEFVIGMCAAWAVRNGWWPRIPVLVGVAGLAGVVVAIAAAPHVAPGSWPAEAVTRLGNELFTVACFVTMVAAASSTLRGGRLLFADRIQIRLGEWSFAFYLVHATVMYAVMRFTEPLAPSWTNIVPALGLLAVALVLSGALYHFVEKPVERRMRQWKDTRDALRRDAAAPDSQSVELDPVLQESPRAQLP